LILGQNVVNGLQKTAQIAPSPATPYTDPTITIDSAVAAPGPSTTSAPFPDADPNAQNFLITGADNGACVARDSPYFAAFGDRTALGARSDTIMVMRVDPSTSRAAVLSFPRDLWVKIDGNSGHSRINSAYSKNNPQKLINTIYANFGIAVQHYIQIDFCAFKSLVDSVGGVSVPFEYAARDSSTGLNVPTAGCFKFSGEAGLAYVRSRHYKYLDPKTGKWKEDPASDYGRISRQQDFLRRTIAKVLSQGTFNISRARTLIDVAQKYVVVDPDLTISKELQFAGVLKRLNPDDLQTYQVEGMGKNINGNAVIEPRLGGANMKAILAIFRGQAQLAAAPEQVFETTTTSTAKPNTTQPNTTKPNTTTTVATTLPEAVASEIVKGIVPPKGITCP
jgi:LCP family protein required for cell wall assembly